MRHPREVRWCDELKIIIKIKIKISIETSRVSEQWAISWSEHDTRASCRCVRVRVRVRVRVSHAAAALEMMWTTTRTTKYAVGESRSSLLIRSFQELFSHNYCSSFFAQLPSQSSVESPLIMFEFKSLVCPALRCSRRCCLCLQIDLQIIAIL